MTQSPAPSLRSPIHNWVVVIVLLLAVLLRVYRLDAVPPGLTHDEASNGHDAAAVLQGVRPIYFTVGYGHEPLYPYSVALVMSLLGPTDTALRLTTVGWGMALILLSCGFARRLFGPLPALLTAAWMATSFWCVMTSRVGLRAITLAVAFTAAALCFWMGFSPADRPSSLRDEKAPRSHWVWWTLSGVFLGASIYTYMASRIMPAVYLLFLAYLAGVQRHLFRQQWLGIVALLLIAALVAAPLIHFLIAHPEAEQRGEQLLAPLQKAARGDFSNLWRNISLTLPMFTWRGDPMWRYNIVGRPLLDPLSGVLFYAGLLVCLWRWRDPRYAFLLLWLTVGAAPALVFGPQATTLRAIAAQPAIFIVTALALTAILRFLRARAGRWGQALGVGGAVALIAGIGLNTTHSYFNVWSEHREVRATYYHALVQQAHYLDAHPESGTVAVSSIYPGRFHDPYTMEIALRRDDLALRWFDGRFAMIFPAGKEARVIIPTIALLDQTLESLFDEHATHLHSANLRPDDLIPHFDVYRVRAADALAAFLAHTRDNPVYCRSFGAFSAAEPQAGYVPLTLPVNLGDVVELIGYDLLTPVVEPGGEIELLTAWRIRAPLTSEAVLFTHLLDPGNRVVGQMDRLDVPSCHWQPGDAFVQLHRFPIDTDVCPGWYHLEVGAYTRQDSSRLSVLVDGTAVDDRALLSPVEVVSQ